MKRPLKPSDVPPGSVIRFKEDNIYNISYNWILVTAVRKTDFVDVAGTTVPWTYEQLMNQAEIKRPGQDWQPCYVEEFNPADYQQGQEVDVEVAQKLYDAGVKLEYQNDRVYPWCSVESLSGNLKNFGSVKFRVATESFDPSQYKPGQEVTLDVARLLFKAGVKIEYRHRKGYPWDTVESILKEGENPPECLEYRIARPKVRRDLRPGELPEFFKVVWPDKGWAVWKREGTCTADIRRLVAHKAAWTTDLNATELNSFQVEDE